MHVGVHTYARFIITERDDKIRGFPSHSLDRKEGLDIAWHLALELLDNCPRGIDDYLRDLFL